MRIQAELRFPSEVSQKHASKLFYLDQICLLIVGTLALVNSFPKILNPVRQMIPANSLDVHFAWAALCSVVGLFLTESKGAKWLPRMGQLFAALTLAIVAVSILGQPAGLYGNLLEVNLSPQLRAQLIPSATALMLVGIATLFVNGGLPVLRRIADGVVICLIFVVMTIALGYFLRLAKVSQPSSTGVAVSSTTLLCLAMLTMVLVVRCMEDGILIVLLGHGTGSQIARTLVPIMLLIPFLRELARAHLLNAHLIPPAYVQAVLTSTATMLGLVLILWLAAIINRIQQKYQMLTLRDELTGLQTMRGFNLLAEQAYRSARRAHHPFSILFIDMDNLKIIND